MTFARTVFDSPCLKIRNQIEIIWVYYFPCGFAIWEKSLSVVQMGRLDKINYVTCFFLTTVELGKNVQKILNQHISMPQKCLCIYDFQHFKICNNFLSHDVVLIPVKVSGALAKNQFADGKRNALQTVVTWSQCCSNYLYPYSLTASISCNFYQLPLTKISLKTYFYLLTDFQPLLLIF